MVQQETESKATDKTNLIPLVCVVIPSWNRKDDLLACLDLLQQSSYPHRHTIVVDNGSTDGTRAAVMDNFPDVTLISLPSNTGASVATNYGIQEAMKAQANYILRLDSDMMVDSEMISELVQFMQTHAEVGLCYPKIFRYDNPEIVWFTGVCKHPLFLIGRALHFNVKEDSSIIARKVDFTAFAAALLRTEVVQKIGRVDEAFFVYFEDYDYCERITRNGYELWLVPDATAKHKIGQENLGQFGTFHYNRGKVIFYRKYSKGPHLLFLVIFSLIYAFYRAWIHRFHEPLGAALGGVLDGLKVRLSKA